MVSSTRTRDADRIKAAMREYADAAFGERWEDVSVMVTRGPGERPVFVVVSRETSRARKAPRSRGPSRG